jgi:hypothetical protein
LKKTGGLTSDLPTAARHQAGCSKALISDSLQKDCLPSREEKENAMSKTLTMTKSSGAPVADNQNSLTAGPPGPVQMQDFHLLKKLAHQNRERIVHAKGSAAYSSIVVTWLGILAAMAIVLGGLAYSSPDDDQRQNAVEYGVIPPFRG